MQVLNLPISNSQKNAEIKTSINEQKVEKSSDKGQKFEELIESVEKESKTSESESVRKEISKVEDDLESEKELESNKKEISEENLIQKNDEILSAELIPSQNPQIQNIINENTNPLNEEITFVSLEESNLLVEDIVLDENQISYLKLNDSSKDDFDILLDNVENYVYNSEEVSLNSAQNLSVDEPFEFLEEMSLTQEFSFSNEIIPEENIALINNSKENSESENSLFKFLTGGKNLSTNQVFTVIDERDLENKIASFENAEGNDFNSLDFTVNLSEGIKENILSTNSQTASASSSTFQQALTQQIQNFAPDFVKAGTFILKNNDSGTINLNLNPESLGNVKLHLELSDNVITGQITVSSKEAYESFKQNIENFKQAFLNNGFEDVSFNLSFASNTGSGDFQNENKGFLQEYFAGNAYKDYISGESVEDLSGLTIENNSIFTDTRIDVVA